MIKLVVFDWNGTLFSDTQAIVVGVNARLSYLEHTPVTIQQYRELFEVPIANTYKKLGLDSETVGKTAKEHSEAFHSAYEARAANVRTRSGAREVLDYLDQKGVKKIILSNHNVNAISKQLKRLKLEHYFEKVLANDTLWAAHFQGKKERLASYLKTTNYKPNEILIIGDTSEETLIGRELGLHTVSITGGGSTAKRLRDAKPDILIHKLRDLINLMEEI